MRLLIFENGVAAETPLVDISRPDSYKNKAFCIEGATERDVTIQYTYRYGYELTEMPALIQACVLDLLSDRLDAVTSSEKVIPDPEYRLKNIAAYRRVFV